LKQEKKCNVAILAGGKGTRLKSRSGELPKPLTQVCGIPILEHQINLCCNYGFTEIAILLHYQSESIKDYFGDGTKYGVTINYVIEKDPRGTAGALKDALFLMQDRFLVLYADTYAEVDLKLFWDFDQEVKSSGSLFLHPNSHPYDSDLVEIDNRDALVKSIKPYPHPDNADYPNLVNAALYILDKSTISKIVPNEGKHDLAKDSFNKILFNGFLLRGYVSCEYIKDMGTPDRLDAVECDIDAGVPNKLAAQNFRTAVFIDRDGVINEDIDYLSNPDELMLIDGSVDAIRSLNKAGLLAIGVTNQPVIARGEAKFSDIEAVHLRLGKILGNSGAYLDKIYFCPHHPHKGFVGEILELKVKCDCRKPATGMIDEAVRNFNISREGSWMIGDRTSDILAGKRSGLKTILVQTGYAGRDYQYEVEPDFVARNLKDAVDWINVGYSLACQKIIPMLPSLTGSRVILIGGPSRTGKTSFARVLKEMLSFSGKDVHLISLDGWLDPDRKAKEGHGVLTRYKLDQFVDKFNAVLHSSHREILMHPSYDSITGERLKDKKISIGPGDILIVEGVVSLLDSRLLNMSNSRIYIDLASESLRNERMVYEYRRRKKESDDEIQFKLQSRENDEVSSIRNNSNKATYKVIL
jgi:histidinol-phosphate phosphatase family domain/HAD-superfamily hydrolase, subfamily IIIA